MSSEHVDLNPIEEAFLDYMIATSEEQVIELGPNGELPAHIRRGMEFQGFSDRMLNKQPQLPCSDPDCSDVQAYNRGFEAAEGYANLRTQHLMQ